MYAMFRPPFAFVSETDEHGKVQILPRGAFFWDGRADTLAEQTKGPFLNPREMNNPSARAVVERVRRSQYAALFRSIFGAASFDNDEMAFDRIAQAIAAFERTPRFRPFSSQFDAFLRGVGTFGAQEALGFALFKDPIKGNCVACHGGNLDSRNPADWLFTDYTFDALGLPRNAAVPENADPKWFDLGLCQQDRAAARAPAGVDVQALCGTFQVPTLRNVELTAPYGHNGVFTNLRDVVRFYVTRDTHPELWYPTVGGRVELFDDLPARIRENVNVDEAPYDRRPGHVPRLNDHEIDAVVAFLRTLTDG